MSNSIRLTVVDIVKASDGQNAPLLIKRVRQPFDAGRFFASGICGASRSVQPLTKGESVQVHVRDNNVDQALKALKKKMQREGIFREMKLRNYYEKPSEKRAREKAEAIRRARKLARKRAQREGMAVGAARGKPATR
jgi:small subunit ribosomal protein S21